MPQKLRSKLAALDSGRFKTYCAIVFAMAAVITVYSLVIVAQLKSDTEENNRRFNEYFNTAVGNNLNGISDFAYNILRSSFSTKMTSDDSMANAAALRHEIYMYKNSNRLVGDIIEYFPSLDMLVGNNGYYSPIVYYKSGGDFGINLTYSQEKFEHWINCLFSDKQAGFYLIDDINGKPAVFYFCSIPNPLDEADRRKVVVILSSDGLVEKLKELVNDGGYKSALLADDNGTVYAHYGEKLGISGTNRFDVSAVGKGYTVSKTNSPLLGLNCITIREKGTAYRIVAVVTKILITADILAVIVGIILSIVYAERNRKELQRLVSLFEPSQSDNLSIEYIEKQIDTLLADNRSVVDEAEKQQRIVDTAFLRDILNRKDATAEEINLLTTLYNEDIANDTFVLSVIEYSSEEIVHSSDIYKVISKYEHENFRIYYAAIKNTLVFMINFDSDSENGRIGKFIAAVKKFLGSSVSITGSATGVPFVSIDDVIKQREHLQKNIGDSTMQTQEKQDIESGGEYVDPAILAHEIAVTEYNNSQLSLQLLAERVGVSQAYLSRVFKQKYGMSVMHYINYLRVEEAKRLITSGDEPLKVIALKVGFISDINLIRVFKKYENITPGSYRAQEEKSE